MQELIQKILKLKTSGKIGVTLGAIAALGAVFYQLVYSDLSDRITRSRARQSELEEERADYVKRKGQYLSYRTELKKLEEQQRELLKVLPRKAEIPSFIASMQEQAEISGLEVLAIDIKPEVVQELYVKIPVNMEIRGGYHQIAKFFKNTSDLQRIVNVENLTLTPDANKAGEQQGAPPRLRAKFVAATFRFKEQAAGGRGS